jgi:hypothetical protein
VELPAQRIALETIISGEACAPLSNFFSVFASTCSEFCETLFLPIHLEANQALRTAQVDIPGVLQSSGRPIINAFNGEPFHVALARPRGSFEFTYAEIGLGTTSVTGNIEMAYEDSWAHWCVHHFNPSAIQCRLPQHFGNFHDTPSPRVFVPCRPASGSAPGMSCCCLAIA